MRKIWTKLATVALILVVMVSFSACSLFTTNLDKKYSAYTMVAKAADSDISVSRQELYYGYLEWGYQYASYYSSTDELLEYITSALLNNKILEQKSLEQFGKLRDVEKAQALKQAYQSLDETLSSYIYEALGVDAPTDDEDTDSETNDVDKPYSPSILVGYEKTEDRGVERVFTMDLSGYADTEGTIDLCLDDYKYYVPTVPGIASQKNAKQAISKIIRNLQTFEDGFTQLKAPDTDYLGDNEYFKLLSKSERAVLNREIDRMVRSNQTSILVNRIGTAYNLGFTTLAGKDAETAWDDYLNRGKDFAAWSDIVNGNQIIGSNPFVKITETEDGIKTVLPAYYGCGRAVATNIANDAIDFYLEKTITAINNQKNFPDNDLESTIMSSGLANLYYVPSDVANNLFTVSHILIGFTDEQKTQYTKIQSEAAQSSSYDLQNKLNELYAQTTSNGVSAYNVWVEVQTALEKAHTVEEKCKIFRQYINQYNSDPGMQNLDQLDSSSQPQFEYLMTTTVDNNTMVEAFTNASIALFEAGEKGAISELVWTDYGAHIIMYTRDIADFIYTGVEKDAVELLRQNYADTLFAKLTSYGNRTRFDTLVDTYFTRSYTNYRYFILNDYKNEHEITIVTSEFKKFF